MQRRRVDSSYMAAWFSSKPTSFPVIQINTQIRPRAVAPR
jgi:hypothetical protein